MCVPNLEGLSYQKSYEKGKISCINMYYQVMAFPIRNAISSIYVVNNVLVVFVCASWVYEWVCVYARVVSVSASFTASYIVMHKMAVLKVPYFYGLHVIKCFYTIYKNIADTKTLSVHLSHLVIPLLHERWI